MEQLYTEPEASDFLRISARTLRSLRAAGAIGYIKVGRRVLYSTVDLSDFIEQNRRREKPQQPTLNRSRGHRLSSSHDFERAIHERRQRKAARGK